MAISARDKMISFRLTTDEYDRYRQLCLEHGIESVSEMARAALVLLFQGPQQLLGQALLNRMETLEGRVHALGLLLRELRERSGSGERMDFAATGVAQVIGIEA